MTAKTFELVHAIGKEPYTLAFGENLDDPDAPFIAVKLHEDGSATVTQRLQRRDKEADALVDSVVEAVLSGKTGIGPPLTYEQIIEVIERLNVAGGGVGWQMGEEVSAMADTPKIMDLTPPDIQTDGTVRIDGRWEAMPVGAYAALEERIRKLEREVETLRNAHRSTEYGYA